YPNSHSVLRTRLGQGPPQILSPLLIPITLNTKTQEETLKAIYAPADVKDKSLLRRLRKCGLLAHPRVDVTVTQLQKAMRTLSYQNRDDTAASTGPMSLPREVFVDCWDTAGGVFGDYSGGCRGGFGGWVV